MKQSPSRAEKQLAKAIGENKIIHKREEPIRNLIPGSTVRYRVDFYLPNYKLVIEVNGRQHGREEIIARDLHKRQLLLSAGYRVLWAFPKRSWKADSQKLVRKILSNDLQNFEAIVI